MTRAVAIECYPLDPETGDRVRLGFCDADDASLTAWNGEFFWPGIFRNLALNREGWNGDWSSPISIAQAAFDVTMLALRRADPGSPVYRWAGAPLTIYSGQRGSPLTVLFEGRVLSHTIEGGELKLTAQVDSEAFEGDALVLTYDGSGLDGGGDEGLREFPKPACFGFCRNVEPVRINNVDNVFQVHGYGSIEGFDGLYERARAYSAPLADYPTYAALVAADVPEGSWATCLAQGMFRMGAPPYGVVTVDVRGDNVGGFHQTTAAIVTRLCEIAGVDAVRLDAPSLAAFGAAVPFPVNLYVTQRETLIDLIQRFVRPCNAQAALSWAGKLQVTRFGGIPTPTLALDAQGAASPAVIHTEELPMLVPWWRLEMTYERNWRPMSKDEIAFDEDLGGVDVQQFVYRRWPVQPPTPTSPERVPLGWRDTPPDMVRAQAFNAEADGILAGWEVPADTYIRAFGPVWMSQATVRGEVVQGEWSEPVLADPRYRGWSIYQFADSDMTDGYFPSLASTNAIRAADYLTEDPFLPSFFINEGKDGPWRLSFRVRNSADMVYAGVCEYDPVEWGPLGIGDVAYGWWTPTNNADYVGVGPGDSDPASGVWPVQFYDTSADIFDDDSAAVRLTSQPAGSHYQLAYDGTMLHWWMDGELVRSHPIDRTWVAANGDRFFPVFNFVSPEAEVYDIQWETVQSSNPFDFAWDFWGGPLRYVAESRRIELTNVNPPFEGIEMGIMGTRSYSGGMKASFRVGPPVGASFTTFASLMIERTTSAVYNCGFGFSEDKFFLTFGTWGTEATFDYNAGDLFGVEYSDDYVLWTHNGRPVHRYDDNERTPSGGLIAGFQASDRAGRVGMPPGRTVYFYAELGGGSYFEDLDIDAFGGGQEVRGSTSTTTFPATHTAAQETVTVSGQSMQIIATSAALTLQYVNSQMMAGIENYQMNVRGTLRMTLTRTSGLDPYKPRLLFQRSVDGGSYGATGPMTGMVEPYGDSASSNLPDLAVGESVTLAYGLLTWQNASVPFTLAIRAALENYYGGSDFVVEITDAIFEWEWAS